MEIETNYYANKRYSRPSFTLISIDENQDWLYYRLKVFVVIE